MGVAERQRRLRPQIAVLHRADHAGRRRLDRRRVGQPPVQVGSPGAVPPLPVQLTHPAARGPVAAPGDPTARVRALPAPSMIGRRGEHVRVRAARVDPAQVMALAHALAAGGPRAALDPAGAAAEHRVLGGEHEDLGPELGPDRAQQLLEQRRAPWDRRPGRRPHSCTALPVSVNQPACSSALAGVFDAEVSVDLDRGGHRGVPEQPAHHLHRGARAQQPGGVGVAAPVRVEVDPGPSAQPADQVIDRGVGQRAAVLPGPEVDEHVVAVQVAVLAVQVVGVEPDQPGADRDRPGLHRLGAGPVVVDPRHHRDRALGRGPVLVAQPQRLPDPHPGVVQHREQQPVPQPVAGVEDRLHLGGGQDPRVLARHLQPDHPPRGGLGLADVVQERAPRRPAPPGRLPAGQQLAQVDAVAGGVLVERADRRQLPVHRRRAAVRRHRGQHRDPPVPGRRGQPQPGHELADVLQPDLAPVQPAAGEEHEPVLQIMGVGLDRVRRAVDVGEEREVALDRLDRHPVRAEHRPRSMPRTGQHHLSNEHRTSRDTACWTAGDNHVHQAEPGTSRARQRRRGHPSSGSR